MTTIRTSGSPATPPAAASLFWRRWLPFLIANSIVLGIVTVGGGMPVAVSPVVFYLGVIIFVGIVFSVVFAVWHLLVRPMPKGWIIPDSPRLSNGQRRTVTTLFGVAAICLIIGGMWDEIWHRTYGVPFGEDFFWRPHLLMYFGFIVIIAAGLRGWWAILREGKGTLRQRFRADPVIGIVTIFGTFLAYSLPADPIWHIVYGEDLSAWSLPHVVLLFTFSAVIIVMFYLQRLTSAPPTWRVVRPADWINVIMMSMIIMPPLLQLTGDYDSMTLARIANPADPIYLRPEWALTASLAFLSAFGGVFGNLALKRHFVASLGAVLALGIRLAMIAIFDTDRITANHWLFAIAPIAAIDLLFFVMHQRGRTVTLWQMTLAALVGHVLIVFPLMAAIVPFPDFSIGNLPVLIAASAVASLIGALIAHALGTLIGNAVPDRDLSLEEERAVETTPSPYLRAGSPLMTIGIYAGAVLFIVWWVVTAAPPI